MELYIIDIACYIIAFVAIFSGIFLIVCLINGFSKRIKIYHLITRCIIFTSLLWLILIYWSPPIKLYEVNKYKPQQQNINISDNKELVIAEFEKAAGEISENSKDNKKWFYYKLILVGVFAGAIIAENIRRQRLPEKLEFTDIISKKYFTITVGLAFILCIIIDIRVRQNFIVTKQLGNWIAYHYEPLMIHSLDSSNNSNKHSFKAWEQFLRIEDDKEIKIGRDTMASIVNNIKGKLKNKSKQSRVTILLDTSNYNYPITLNEFSYKHMQRVLEDSLKDSLKDTTRIYWSSFSSAFLKYFDGDEKITKAAKNQLSTLNMFRSQIHHRYPISNSTFTDIFYSLFHFPAFHILTWLLYLFFLCSFYHFICGNIIGKKLNAIVSGKYRMSLDFIFGAVHVMILLFAILSRAQAGIFEMNYSFFSQDLFIPPRKAGLFNLTLAFIFIFLPNAIIYYFIRYKYLKKTD
jgi:hypothetical protein